MPAAVAVGRLAGHGGSRWGLSDQAGLHRVGAVASAWRGAKSASSTQGKSRLGCVRGFLKLSPKPSPRKFIEFNIYV